MVETEIHIEHFIHDIDYSDTYFWICVDNAKNKLKSEGFNVDCRLWTTNTTKNAIISGY